MSKLKALGGWVLNHVIAFVFFVLLPGLVTAIAPVTWLELLRTQDGIQATGKTCSLFVIPFYVQRIANVEQLDEQVVRGQRTRSRTTKKESRPEDQGFITLANQDESIKLQVSPASIARVQAQIQQFLETDQPPRRTWILVANWKFSVLAGGCVSILSILYGVGMVLSIGHFLLRCVWPRRSMESA